jgi:hypothetical protein
MILFCDVLFLLLILSMSFRLFKTCLILFRSWYNMVLRITVHVLIAVCLNVYSSHLNMKHLLYVSTVWLRYIYIVPKNFISNCQHHIILFAIFWRFYVLKIIYFRHSLSFPLYIYFSFVKVEISDLQSNCKIYPLCILVIRPDNG